MSKPESAGSVYVYTDPHGRLFIDVFRQEKKIQSESVDKIFDVAWAIERYTKKHGISEIYNGTPPGIPHILKQGDSYIYGYRPLSSEVLNRVLKALKEIRFEI